MQHHHYITSIHGLSFGLSVLVISILSSSSYAQSLTMPCELNRAQELNCVLGSTKPSINMGRGAQAMVRANAYVGKEPGVGDSSDEEDVGLAGLIGLGAKLGVLEIDGILSNGLQPVPNSVESQLRVQSHFGLGAAQGVVGVGRFAKTWGPAQRSPLVRSAAHAPYEQIFIGAASSQTALESQGFTFDAEFNVGRLGTSRVVASPLLMGTRLEAGYGPVQLGLSRAAMLGGEGRSTSGRDWLNSFLGRDNQVDDQPGNQLAGVDIAITHQSASSLASVYFETAGEDEAGYAPAKKFFVAGGQYARAFDAVSMGVVIEHANTISGSLSGDERPNITYSHFIYQTGYTHEGRPIGSPFGGDTQTTSLGLWSRAINGLHTNFWVDRVRQRETPQYKFNLDLELSVNCFTGRCSLALMRAPDFIADGIESTKALSIGYQQRLW